MQAALSRLRTCVLYFLRRHLCSLDAERALSRMVLVSDGSPSYRGYRCQSLYVLSRILRSGKDAANVIQPEGLEDLAIFDADGQLIEVVQVKALGTDLALSSFDPQRPDSFFYRAAQLLRTTPNPKITVASFGPIGPEMTAAWGSDVSARERVAAKLAGYGALTNHDAREVIQAIHLAPVSEAALTREIRQSLKRMATGIDPEPALELLLYWVYVCSEHKTKISQANVIRRVDQVGRFLAERAAHHQHWFTSIVPIQDRAIPAGERDRLAEEFYRGVGARYEHILAGVDASRPMKVEAIDRKFEDANVVIIHGASGQGKTSLAYRYLHEHLPEEWRYQVTLIENRQHAASIAAALAGHADAIGVPLAVYIDVSPADSEWPELVRTLAGHAKMRILVTIREEDWRRASLSGAELDFSAIELSFDETEGRHVYEQLSARRVPSQFLTFEEAWRKFGAQGPLMEFVHLITQGDSLRERLSQQIRRLQDDVRKGALAQAEMKLLRMVGVASALQGRLRLKDLAERLGLAEARRTVELFEREYLVRVSEDGSLLSGLHPIRSEIIAELTSDPTLHPWSETASECLPIIHVRDLESFLLHAFSRHRQETGPLLEALADYHPEDWVSVVSILRALLWLGLAEYVEANKTLIEETHEDSGHGWILLIDWDIAGAAPTVSSSMWSDLGSLVSRERLETIAEFRRRQKDKRQVFEPAKSWLSGRLGRPSPPSGEAEWSAMAETLFWVGRLEADWSETNRLAAKEIESQVDYLPIDILADLTLGLAQAYGQHFSSWMEANRAHLKVRFRQETFTPVLEDDGEKLTAHFIVRWLTDGATEVLSHSGDLGGENPLHQEATLRVSLLRRLFPDRETYACQGYGHRLWQDSLPVDDTRKTGIPKSRLPPRWLTNLNSNFRGLAEQEFRPRDWREYAQLVLSLRRTVLEAATQLRKSLQAYLRKAGPMRLLGGSIDPDQWDRCRRAVGDPPLLPRCAVDEWGFVDESSARALTEDPARDSLVAQNGLVIREYKPFLNVLRTYTAAFSNFMGQSVQAMVLNAALRQARSQTARTAVMQQAAKEGIRADAPRLSAANLAGGVESIPQLQREFRRLFGHFFDQGELQQLEREEAKAYGVTFSMWHFFASHPSATFQDAARECPKRFRGALKKLHNRLQQEFRRFPPDGPKVRILSDDEPWHDEPALWVTVDGSDAIVTYGAAEDVVAAIRRAFETTPNGDLGRYALSFHWPSVILVPLVLGKSLTLTAWRFHSSLLAQRTDSGATNWWNFVPAPIPDDAARSLRLTKWESPGLQLGSKLLEATAQLAALAGHVRDWKDLPDTDDVGQRQLEQYLANIVPHMNRLLQSVLDSATEMASAIGKVPEPERSWRAHLCSAAGALHDLHDSVLPTQDFDGEAAIGFEKLTAWAGRLEQARHHAFLIFLYWAMYIF